MSRTQWRIEEDAVDPGNGELTIAWVAIHSDWKVTRQDEFEGILVHSSEYKTAKEYVGKKVVVIGSATSGESLICILHVNLLIFAPGHDISADCVHNGVGKFCKFLRGHSANMLVDVTMCQRGGTYVLSNDSVLRLLSGESSPM
jgi:hypothetical protein